MRLIHGELSEHIPGPEQQWYNEGYDALAAGMDRHSNPYKDHRALCWDEGWETAAQYAEAAEHEEC